VVVIKSTSKGDTSAFDKQDGLYTLTVRGIEGGEKVEENIINASISRVLNAQEDWDKILQCAHNIEIQIIISNTTEVGIQLSNDNIRDTPPKSFPGKLLAYLFERYKAFEGSKLSGMVIVPTELIPDNGKKLESIVMELAHLNGMDDQFIEWLEGCNHFCNSLVDRIVPGKPDDAFLQAIEEEVGYQDQLLTMSEGYRLWAIEGNDHVRNTLTFAEADKGVIIKDNIDVFREIKLRLLNGTHTFSCGIAVLSGCDTVKEAMDDEVVSTYITDLMEEIAPAIPYDVDLDAAHAFGRQVLDRFRNPHIKHLWSSITVNYSSKLKMRCIPLILSHYQKYNTVPVEFALGFAAYIRYMKSVEKKGDQYYGAINDDTYLIQDEMAPVFYKRWAGLSTALMVKEVLCDVAFWGADLSALPGFKEVVIECLNFINSNGMKDAIEHMHHKKVFAA
jgi:tagaturonate reductase